MAETAPSPPIVHTIGHSTRSVEALIDLLRAADVRRVIDLRTIPRSRHNPQFDRATFPDSLAAHGIGYRHAPELGGLRRPARDSANGGWRNASFRGFADYMQTPTFDRAIRDLVEEARATPLAILCAEAVPWRCHRSLVADALDVRGVRVLHIIGGRSPSPHVRTAFAVVDGERLRYPPVPVAAHPLESFGGSAGPGTGARLPKRRPIARRERLGESRFPDPGPPLPAGRAGGVGAPASGGVRREPSAGTPNGSKPGPRRPTRPRSEPTRGAGADPTAGGDRTK